MLRICNIAAATHLAVVQVAESADAARLVLGVARDLHAADGVHLRQYSTQGRGKRGVEPRSRLDATTCLM